jgi:hypothetical protein
MGIDYAFNAGYGFIVMEKDMPRPAQWEDDEMWYEGIIDKEIDGSGLTAVLGGNMWTGERLWGFVAEDTFVRLNKFSNEPIAYIRDIDPTVVGNVYDMRARCKIPQARLGWVMWMDVT